MSLMNLCVLTQEVYLPTVTAPTVPYCCPLGLEPGWGFFLLFSFGRQVLEGYTYLEKKLQKCIVFVTSSYGREKKIRLILFPTCHSFCLYNIKHQSLREVAPITADSSLQSSKRQKREAANYSPLKRSGLVVSDFHCSDGQKYYFNL